MNNFIKKTVDTYSLFKYVYLLWYLTIIFLPIEIPIMFYVIVPIINIITFLMYKDYSKSAYKDFAVFKIGMVFLCFALINLGKRRLTPIIKQPLMLLMLEIMLDITVGISLAIAFTSKLDVQHSLLDKIAIRKKLERVSKKAKSEKRYSSEDDEDDEYSVPAKFDIEKCKITICNNKETRRPIEIEGLDRMLHTIIIGPTGCGKSSMAFLPMMLQDLQRGEGCGVICIEPKNDLAQQAYMMALHCGRKDATYFNPIYPDCPKFNPLEGRDESEVIERLTTIFTMLTPDTKQYFKDQVSNLMRKALMTLKRIEQAYMDTETGISSRPATLIELSNLLNDTEGKGKAYANELARLPYVNEQERAQNLETQQWFLNDYFGNASKGNSYRDTSSVRNQLNNLIQNRHLRRVLNPENGKSDINFDKQLAEGRCMFITTLDGEFGEMSTFLGYFLIYSLQSAIFKRPGDEWNRTPNFLYIDEAQTYLSPSFAPVLAKGRSFRCGCVIASQNRKAFTMLAGHQGDAFLNTIDTNCRNIVVFPGISNEDAKYYQERFGTKKVVEERTGQSTRAFGSTTKSVQYSEREVPLFSSTQIINKEFMEITYAIIKRSTVTPAGNGVVSFIPQNINETTKKMVKDYAKKQRKKQRIIDDKEQDLRSKRYAEFNSSNMNNGTLGAHAQMQQAMTSQVPPQVPPQVPSQAAVPQVTEQQGFSWNSQINIAPAFQPTPVETPAAENQTSANMGIGSYEPAFMNSRNSNSINSNTADNVTPDSKSEELKNGEMTFVFDLEEDIQQDSDANNYNANDNVEYYNEIYGDDDFTQGIRVE